MGKEVVFMQGKKKFMAGNSDFLSLQAGGFYYVDKTLLIRDLLDHPAEKIRKDAEYEYAPGIF